MYTQYELRAMCQVEENTVHHHVACTTPKNAIPSHTSGFGSSTPRSTARRRHRGGRNRQDSLELAVSSPLVARKIHEKK